MKRIDQLPEAFGILLGATLGVAAWVVIIAGFRFAWLSLFGGS